MISRQTVLAVLTTSALTFSIGTDPAQSAGLAAAAVENAELPNDKDPDRGLRQDIKTALRSDPALRDAHVAVAARDGQVRLAGVVASEEQRHRAQQVTMAVAGVREVDNGLEIVGR